ncbi:MAG: HAMP domain-containing sensor histidine kinase [Armatimonadota bacterium]|nr:HAMP domain-containing sensor histidine kinase [Armatimonadota bacterium]
MAAETLVLKPTQAPETDLILPALEALARAAAGDAPTAAAVVTEQAALVLDCEVALIVSPATGGDAVQIAGAWPDDAGCEAPPHAPRGLGEHLAGLGMASWRRLPLQVESHPPLALVVASRGEQPCAQMHLLEAFARSGAVALAAAEPAGAWPASVDVRDLERMRAVSQLIFGVSHSLANVFGGILGNLYFLREAVEQPRSRELLDRVTRSVRQGIELVGPLEAFAARPMEAGMGPVDLSELAAEVVALVSAICEPWPQCAGLELRAPPSSRAELPEPCPAWGDSRRLSLALIRVIGNAIEAVHGAGRVVVETETDGTFSRLRVIDDGPGMDEEAARRATEPFFTTAPETHQGLGLAAARAVAVAHRGSLKIARGPAGGTAVTLQIPANPPVDASAGAAPSGPAAIEH